MQPCPTAHATSPMPIAARQAGRPVVSLGEVTSERALRAILSVFPLDTYVDYPLERMEVKDDRSIVTEKQVCLRDRLEHCEGKGVSRESLATYRTACCVWRPRWRGGL